MMNDLATLPRPGAAAASRAPRRWLKWGGMLAGLLVLAWAGVALWGEAAGAWAAAHLPGPLEKAGAGKVPSAAAFATARLHEGVALVALALATVVGAGWFLARLGRDAAFARVLAVAAALLVLANGAAWLAGGQALFWLALQARGQENQASFRAKERLLREIRGVPRLALVGSSQANTQLREELFNRALGGQAWLVDLHFPGSTAADVYFVTERFGPGEVEGFVYYASPLSFGSVEMTTARDLLRLRDLPELARLGVWRVLPQKVARYTALGLLSPLFQYRSPWINAITGTNTLELPGPRGVAARRALREEDFSAFQQRAFLRMLERVAAKGQRLVVIAGQYHPDLEARDDPAFRQRYAAFLEEACARWPNVTLVWQDDLLPQSAADYRDGTHVTEEAGERFTRRLVEAWRKWRWP